MGKYQVIGAATANRRRDRRNAMPPIELEIEDVTYTTIDWGLGGFLVDPYEGTGRVGEPIALTIAVHIADRCYRHKVEAEIVRVDRRTRQMAAAFMGLPSEAMDTLEGLITGRLRRLPH